MSQYYRMLQYSGGSTDFIMTIDTTKAGSASNTFILPCINGGVYDAVIDWGDGSTSNITTYNDVDLTHVYSVSGVYQLKTGKADAPVPLLLLLKFIGESLGSLLLVSNHILASPFSLEQ